MASLIEELIAELARNSEKLRTSRLMDLSNLRAADLIAFKQAWAGLDKGQRRQIMHRLVDLADENFELNFDPIFATCLSDADAEVRGLAIEGLQDSEEPSLIKPLVELLERDISENVQAAAATALGNFAMLGEFDKLRDSYRLKVERALLAAVDDKGKSLEVRRRALEAVAPISHHEVKQSIMRAYRSNDLELKISAISAMGKNCDNSWLPILLKELNSPNSEMRYRAIDACGELGEEEAVPYLSNLVTGPDSDVVLPAIWALGKIGGDAAREFLEQCLSSPEELVSAAAAQALNEMETWEDLFRL